VITWLEGDLVVDDAEALVAPVNIVGVAGKGLALSLARKYPGAFAAYKQACAAGWVRAGRVTVFPTDGKIIIAFPTKRHWRHPSRIEWIKEGLDNLVIVIKSCGIGSVAIPALGCGLGGLNWADVRPLIVDAATRLPDVDVRLYPPSGVS